MILPPMLGGRAYLLGAIAGKQKVARTPIKGSACREMLHQLFIFR
jgi:hypothetical protein